MVEFRVSLGFDLEMFFPVITAIAGLSLSLIFIFPSPTFFHFQCPTYED